MRSEDLFFRAWFGVSQSSLVHSLRCLANDLECVGKCDATQVRPVAINTWALAQRSVPCLIGRTLGHPSVGDGRPALSSELFYFDPDRGIARTMSRWYRLGTRVDPDYWTERLAGRS
ncbi:DUF6634 family protein [Sinorhizobium mexicanum]|uniref:Uncharacterized protein n=1 Tax=Sinorhizobium mexicanum TaxID=375549 RepID=A0A859QPU9_9HYPH|nr:hypothetical protein FKV68_08420 [Sinorhizobium mexicanum]